MTIGPIFRPPASPRIVVGLEDVRPRGRAWRVRWRLRNAGDRSVTVLEAWHPHRRFRSSRLVRSVRIPAGGSATIDMPARTDARAGEPVENGFLILRVASGGERFRVLARFAVSVDPAGIPRPQVRAVDVHPAQR